MIRWSPDSAHALLGWLATRFARVGSDRLRRRARAGSHQVHSLEPGRPRPIAVVDRRRLRGSRGRRRRPRQRSCALRGDGCTTRRLRVDGLGFLGGREHRARAGRSHEPLLPCLHSAPEGPPSLDPNVLYWRLRPRHGRACPALRRRRPLDRRLRCGHCHALNVSTHCCQTSRRCGNPPAGLPAGRLLKTGNSHPAARHPVPARGARGPVNPPAGAPRNDRPRATGRRRSAGGPGWRSYASGTSRPAPRSMRPPLRSPGPGSWR
jgi:hypothetical protein